MKGLAQRRSGALLHPCNEGPSAVIHDLIEGIQEHGAAPQRAPALTTMCVTTIGVELHCERRSVRDSAPEELGGSVTAEQIQVAVSLMLDSYEVLHRRVVPLILAQPDRANVSHGSAVLVRGGQDHWLATARHVVEPLKHGHNCHVGLGRHAQPLRLDALDVRRGKAVDVAAIRLSAMEAATLLADEYVATAIPSVRAPADDAITMISGYPLALKKGGHRFFAMNTGRADDERAPPSPFPALGDGIDELRFWFSMASRTAIGDWELTGGDPNFLDFGGMSGGGVWSVMRRLPEDDPTPTLIGLFTDRSTPEGEHFFGRGFGLGHVVDLLK